MNKVTMKETKRSYKYLIQVDYCGLQSLLNLVSPSAYTSGVYGWNADIYAFGSAAIVTGYRTFGNIVASRELCKEYEQKAKDILDLFDVSWDSRREALYNLIEDFIEEVLE